MLMRRMALNNLAQSNFMWIASEEYFKSMSSFPKGSKNKNSWARWALGPKAGEGLRTEVEDLKTLENASNREWQRKQHKPTSCCACYW